MLSLGVMDLQMPHFDFNQSDFTEVDAELSQEIPWQETLGARSGVMPCGCCRCAGGRRHARRELTTAMAVAYYRLEYTVTALETLRHPTRASRSRRPAQHHALCDGGRASERSLQAKLAAIACDPKSWHWRASESPRSPQ